MKNTRHLKVFKFLNHNHLSNYAEDDKNVNDAEGVNRWVSMLRHYESSRRQHRHSYQSYRSPVEIKSFTTPRLRHTPRSSSSPRTTPFHTTVILVAGVLSQVTVVSRLIPHRYITTRCSWYLFRASLRLAECSWHHQAR